MADKELDFDNMSDADFLKLDGPEAPPTEGVVEEDPAIRAGSVDHNEEDVMPDRKKTSTQRMVKKTTTTGILPTAMTHFLAVMSLMVPGMTILPMNLTRKETKIHPAMRTPMKGLGLSTHTQVKIKPGMDLKKILRKTVSNPKQTPKKKGRMPMGTNRKKEKTEI